MCARYTLTLSLEEMVSAYGLIRADPFFPRYNIAPAQPVPVVRRNPEGTREMNLLRWGLVPRWAKDASVGARLFNARSETVAEKPSFRSAFRFRRCLMPADGFYEWKALDGRKQPFYIRLSSGDPFAFAALWEIWESPDGEHLETCALLTTEPNRLMRDIHNRMPVILSRDDYQAWLEPSASKDELSKLLRPFPPEQMEAVPVSTYVNNPKNEGPKCVERVA